MAMNDVLILVRAKCAPERGGYLLDNGTLIGGHRARVVMESDDIPDHLFGSVARFLLDALSKTVGGLATALRVGSQDVRVEVRVPPVTELVTVEIGNEFPEPESDWSSTAWDGILTEVGMAPEGTAPCPLCGQAGSEARQANGALCAHATPGGGAVYPGGRNG